MKKTIDTRTPKGEYHVAFDTSAPAFIAAVKVTLEVDMLPNDGAAPKHLQETYRVDLCLHPLYRLLEQYVRANPSKP